MQYLLVGLGNPDSKYDLTRHNAGFLMIDFLVDSFELRKKGKKFKSILYEGEVEGQKVLAIKPQTYMNLSGEAVQLVAAFYKIPRQNIIVIFDDYELPLGQIRLRQKGSAGTHNGMKSIIQMLKTQEFNRLRIGIGPKPPEQTAEQFVLSNFTNKQLNSLETVLKQSEEAITLGLRDYPAAMNKWNKKIKDVD